jgi:hypothetical protein
MRIGSNPHIELYAGHVGYAVEPAHRGHRYASRTPASDAYRARIRSRSVLDNLRS